LPARLRRACKAPVQFDGDRLNRAARTIWNPGQTSLSHSQVEGFSDACNVSQQRRRSPVPTSHPVSSPAQKKNILTMEQIWKLSACMSLSIPGRHLALTACPIWRLAFLLTSPTARARTHQQPAWTAVSIASLYQRPLARRYLLFSTSTPSLRTASRAWRPLMLSSATIDLPTTVYAQSAQISFNCHRLYTQKPG
jgi:hypothetical protein